MHFRLDPQAVLRHLNWYQEQTSVGRENPHGSIASFERNRIMLQVEDLAGCVEALKKEGLRFRNDIESGPGGKQIQLEDPDGNPIELFEPSR